MKKIIASYGAGEGIAKGLNILLTLSLAALVDTNSYGIISLLVALELMLTEIMVLGQHTSLLRFFESYRNAISRLYSASLALVMVASAIVLVLIAFLPLTELRVFAGSLRDNDLLILSLGVAIQCHFLLYLSYLRAVDKVLEYCAVRISYQIAKFLVVGGAVVILREASAYPIGVLLANVLFFTVLLPRINRRTRAYSDISKVSADVLRQNLRIGLPLTFHTVVLVVYSIADRFFLARLLDREQLAIYSFASVQGAAVFFIINVLALAYVPRIYRGQVYNRESASMLSEFLYTAMMGAVGVAIIIYFVIYPFSLQFVAAQYADGKVVLLLALVAVGLQPISAFGVYKLTLLGNVAGVPLATMVALICNLSLNWVLIPIYGIEGAGVAAVASQLVAGVLMSTFAYLVANRSVGSPR